METCETCKFFKELYLTCKEPPHNTLGIHKCRRYPEPIDVNIGHWCGEYKWAEVVSGVMELV